MTAPGDPPVPPPVGPPARPPASQLESSPEVELVPPAASTSDWPAQAADTIVDLVDQVRTKTTGPAITVSRAFVFGLIVVVLAVIVMVLALIFLVRLITDLLELAIDDAVWLTYLLLGAVFTIGGALVFGRRHVRGLD
jgi:hypothetical protein